MNRRFRIQKPVAGNGKPYRWTYHRGASQAGSMDFRSSVTVPDLSHLKPSKKRRRAS